MPSIKPDGEWERSNYSRQAEAYYGESYIHTTLDFDVDDITENKERRKYPCFVF